MSLSSIPIPLHFRVFNFILYVGYTEQALKGYQGKTIPSVGILNKFRCPIHNRTEFLYGTDIDEPVVSLKDVYRQDNCIITKTKYGNHIICNDHIESISIAQEKIHLLGSLLKFSHKINDKSVRECSYGGSDSLSIISRLNMDALSLMNNVWNKSLVLA